MLKLLVKNCSQLKMLQYHSFYSATEKIWPLMLFDVPYKSTIKEIESFFTPYAIIPESLKIEYNFFGIPAGRAIVKMETEKDLMRVYEQFQKKILGGRKITIKKINKDIYNEISERSVLEKNTKNIKLEDFINTKNRRRNIIFTGLPQGKEKRYFHALRLLLDGEKLNWFIEKIDGEFTGRGMISFLYPTTAKFALESDILKAFPTIKATLPPEQY